MGGGPASEVVGFAEGDEVRFVRRRPVAVTPPGASLRDRLPNLRPVLDVIEGERSAALSALSVIEVGSNASTSDPSVPPEDSVAELRRDRITAGACGAHRTGRWAG